MFRNILFSYAFFYPLFMAWIWMVGGTWYYWRWERRIGLPDSPPEYTPKPYASILIPCFNEEQNVQDTVAYALASDYPNFEVIAINDGSTDNTKSILNELAKAHANLRIVHLHENEGKALAMRAGAIAARSDYLVCIDGDALLHPTAVTWIMWHFLTGVRVGAVTGNPRILNRTTILGKLQVGEFSSIIGLIKRAQRVYGKIFTVSGVIGGFRKTALHHIGYWSEIMATEDIDISWRMQLAHWDVRYEPCALCYIYMPETLRGLWKQRLRWAQGGVEVLLHHGKELFSWRSRRFWGVAIEYLASVIWAYAMLTIILLYFAGVFIPIAPSWYVYTLLPQWNGVVLGCTCLVQFTVSMIIDKRYEPDRKYFRTYFWIVWYPLVFWLINLATVVVAVPKVLISGRAKRARWVSPDRGLRPREENTDV